VLRIFTGSVENREGDNLKYESGAEFTLFAQGEETMLVPFPKPMSSFFIGGHTLVNPLVYTLRCKSKQKFQISKGTASRISVICPDKQMVELKLVNNSFTGEVTITTPGQVVLALLAGTKLSFSFQFLVVFEAV